MSECKVKFFYWKHSMINSFPTMHVLITNCHKLNGLTHHTYFYHTVPRIMYSSMFCLCPYVMTQLERNLLSISLKHIENLISLQWNDKVSSPPHFPKMIPQVVHRQLENYVSSLWMQSLIQANIVTALTLITLAMSAYLQVTASPCV